MAVNANTQIYDKTIDRAAMIRLYERRVNGKVALNIDGHVERLDDLIKGAQLSESGFLRLREAVDQELLRNARDNYNITKRSLLDLAGDQFSYTVQKLEAAIGQIWSVHRPDRRVDEDIVLRRPLHNDQTLAQGWASISQSERVRLEAEIRRGMAEGLTAAQLAVRIRKGHVNNITYTQSKALVVTAITSVQNQVDQEIYGANEKSLRGYQYIAVLDSRTTSICAHRDGSIFPIGDLVHLPPAHFNCRSTTVPVFKSWDDMAKLEGVAQVRKNNIEKLTPEQIAFYDGQAPLRETYNDWLHRQPQEVKLRHLGDYQRVEMFDAGDLTVDKFTNDAGNSIGIKELRRLSDDGYVLPGDTKRFATAKQKLDSMQLGASTPDDFYTNQKLVQTLKDYYLLQSGELNGTLSLTNYRGILLSTKSNARRRVLNSPPTEAQLKFNPIIGRYEDARLYSPDPSVLSNNLRLIQESDKLLDRDKKFISDFIDSLGDQMSMNERAVVADNLRIVFGRFRDNKEVWGNFKAVVQGQIKFDVLNVSDALETHIRRDSDLLKKLMDSNYIDPVLGPTQLDKLHKEFIPAIRERNKWEDSIAPKIARELRGALDINIPIVMLGRISERDLQQFYLKFAHRLSLADTPDRDQFAVALGRDLFNLANMNGNRREWYNLGLKILESKKVSKFYEIETLGVQKRRMKSRLSGQYFGPYYDSTMFVIRATDPRIQRYAKLNRTIEVGLRVGVTNSQNRLVFRQGFKTYFIDGPLGLEDTRIPITSTSSFSDFPEEFVDENLVEALNWAAKSEYRIDPDFYDAINKLLYFKDDRGKSEYYDSLNHYRKFIVARGDAYERFKAMEWLRDSGKSFSNHPFVDHRARIYDRGLISPQSGETFRPFLNTRDEKYFSPEEFSDLQDQIGSFLGGLDDFFEGRFNSLSITGRQKIAEKWRPALIDMGNKLLRGKPNDIRAVLESDLFQKIDGEDIGKAMRFAVEMAKMDKYLQEKSLLVYQEPGYSYVEIGDGGSVIDVNRAHKLVHTKHSVEVDIDDIAVPLDESFTVHANRKLSRDDEKRIKNATLDASVIVEEIDGPTVSDWGDYMPKKKVKYLWVDGYHRLVKAKRDGIKKINVKILTSPELKQAVVESPEDLLPGTVDEIIRAKPAPIYGSENLLHLKQYKTALALEQDASSSGAQIIALTTRNKQLAELSNVVPTTQKRRLYDEIAASTYNDPRFREMNKRLGLSEKDLRKAAKAQNMVTFYGAGEKTGILNVEGKLAKVLNKESGTLVVTASDRETVLNEISARIARYEKYDPETAEELRQLRENVKDIFNKGVDPGDDIMEQLFFLDPQTRDLVDKMSLSYNKVVTPNDFKDIAKIMSEHLREQVPILKEFTRFFGRLAEDFLTNAKPSQSAFDWKSIAKIAVRGTGKRTLTLPDNVSEFLGLRAGEPVQEKILKRFAFWNPNSSLYELIYGANTPENRRVGTKFFGVDILQLKTLGEVEFLFSNNLPKSWTNVPWVNFDGKVIEQNFTQTFEERLVYKDRFGNWTTNIIQVPQKTEASWWEQIINKSGKIYDIADATKARTAFAVNGNHSNDAVLVKRFHQWGKKNNISTSTIHDAFFTNAADMLKARAALRGIYADALESNVILNTLNEMKARGLPKELYTKYLNEAIEIGLIPVPGKSTIGGKIVEEKDILKRDDILRQIPSGFKDDFGWYGVG